MKKRCGKKCFLGPNISFPVCKKNTCKISEKGLWAAYIRAEQWGNSRNSYKTKFTPRHKRSVYKSVARKAKTALKRGIKVGKKLENVDSVQKDAVNILVLNKYLKSDSRIRWLKSGLLTFIRQHISLRKAGYKDVISVLQ